MYSVFTYACLYVLAYVCVCVLNMRVGSALWVPASSGDSPDLRLLGRRVMEEEVTRCVSRLEELLRGNVGCPALLPETDDLLLSVFVCSRLVQQWTGFMAGVCQACMKVPASVLGRGGGGGVSAITVPAYIDGCF